MCANTAYLYKAKKSEIGTCAAARAAVKPKNPPAPNRRQTETAMIFVALASLVSLALAPFAARIADAIRPCPRLAGHGRVCGPHVAAFDAGFAGAWGWA
jgi:hypothetical protein